MGTILEALKELNKINESKDDRKRFINKFGKKVDNILIEDLDTMLRYYNNLQNWDKQELLNFLTKDPTWNNNREQGQYSKWILDKLNRNLLNNSNLGHLHDVLKRFEDNKKYLINKDINRFKSIQEIDTYLNDDNNYNELSHSQVVRQHRKDKQNVDLNNEAELIYRDSDWEVWSPKTYAASCKLGQGSSWCTASTESSHYFDGYIEEGPLYIILNKHDEKEKYQFHFESGSYMDINDEEIYLLDFIVDESNEKWINALRQCDKYFDKKCEGIFNNAKKAREELNNFLQKNKSIESIKYPTQKDIIKDFKKFTYGSDHYEYLTIADLNKIQNLKIEIENNVTEIEPWAFKGMDWINQVIFEKNSKLRCIGTGAFSDCSSIVELDLPNSINQIEVNAFRECNNLESIILPSNLSGIRPFVFGECRKLKNIVISENIKYIGNYAFQNCTSLVYIEIPNKVIIIGDSAFYGCTSLRNITLPESLISIGKGAFRSCTSLNEITIPNSVRSIGEDAFHDCTSLTKVVIDEGITDIEWCAFNGCKSLTSIEIPSSVTSIGSNAFSGCTSLTNITFEEESKLTAIKGQAFERCTSLTNITIPSSVTSIGKYAFWGCTSLASITIPESVTSIRDEAFRGCPNLVIKTANPYIIDYCIENNIKYEKID